MSSNHNFVSVQVDSLSDETKMETQRDINTRALDEMATVNGGIQVLKYERNLHYKFHKWGFPKSGRFQIYLGTWHQ